MLSCTALLSMVWNIFHLSTKYTSDISAEEERPHCGSPMQFGGGHKASCATARTNYYTSYFLASTHACLHASILYQVLLYCTTLYHGVQHRIVLCITVLKHLAHGQGPAA